MLCTYFFLGPDATDEGFICDIRPVSLRKELQKTIPARANSPFKIHFSGGSKREVKLRHTFHTNKK